MEKRSLSKYLMISFPITTLITVMGFYLGVGDDAIAILIGLSILGFLLFMTGIFLYLSKGISQEHEDGVKNYNVVAEIPQKDTEQYGVFQKYYKSAYRIGKRAKIMIIGSIISGGSTFILGIVSFVLSKRGLYPTFIETQSRNILDQILQIRGIMSLISGVLFLIFAILVTIYIYRNNKALVQLGYYYKSNTIWNIIINIGLLTRGIILIPYTSYQYIFRLNKYLINNKSIPYENINIEEVTKNYYQYILIGIIIIQKIIDEKIIGKLWDRNDKIGYLKYLNIAQYDILTYGLGLVATLIIYQVFEKLYKDQKHIVESGKI